MKKLYAIVFVFLVLLAVFLLKHFFIFRSEIAGGYDLVQVFGEDKYNIESDGVIVEGVSGWIVSKDLIYGSKSNGEYFAIDRDAGKSFDFTDLYLFNKFLKSYGLGRHDMSLEKNITYLK